MCNVQALITAGMLLLGEGDELDEENLTPQYVSNEYRSNSLTACRRARSEYCVFQKLLNMIPCLADRLVECSEEECMGISDLVSTVFLHCVVTPGSPINSQQLAFIPDTEGCVMREVGRNKIIERRGFGLDNTKGNWIEPSSCTQCQDKSRVPPPCHWGASLSRWIGLVRPPVRNVRFDVHSTN